MKEKSASSKVENSHSSSYFKFHPWNQPEDYVMPQPQLEISEEEFKAILEERKEMDISEVDLDWKKLMAEQEASLAYKTKKLSDLGTRIDEKTIGEMEHLEQVYSVKDIPELDITKRTEVVFLAATPSKVFLGIAFVGKYEIDHKSFMECFVRRDPPKINGSF